MQQEEVTRHSRRVSGWSCRQRGHSPEPPGDRSSGECRGKAAAQPRQGCLPGAQEARSPRTSSSQQSYSKTSRPKICLLEDAPEVARAPSWEMCSPLQLHG